MEKREIKMKDTGWIKRSNWNVTHLPNKQNNNFLIYIILLIINNRCGVEYW